ncbi:MAG: glutathione peroxidase [Gammaproteobacteria bacterium]|nr:glutathione peroxidase [Gammaproteobacteria bacterium]
MTQSIYDIVIKNRSGEPVSMERFRGKVLLIVNTASNCGFTSQYEALEDLYKNYKESGLEIIGFPCNQFMKQEPGSDEEIAEFCSVNYGVTFPVFGKINVNGSAASPLYKKLKSDAPGVLGSQSIKWNFTKFLVNKEGKVIKRSAPTVAPQKLVKDIEAAINTA